MTIRLRSNDCKRRLKKRNPVCKSIQGFLFRTIKFRSEVLSLKSWAIKLSTPDYRLKTLDSGLLHHATHTAAAHWWASRSIFRIIGQYNFCC